MSPQTTTQPRALIRRDESECSERGWRAQLSFTFAQRWFRAPILHLGADFAYAVDAQPDARRMITQFQLKDFKAHRDTKLEAGDRIIVFAPTAIEQEVRKALFG